MIPQTAIQAETSLPLFTCASEGHGGRETGKLGGAGRAGDRVPELVFSWDKDSIVHLPFLTVYMWDLGCSCAHSPHVPPQGWSDPRKTVLA